MCNEVETMKSVLISIRPKWCDLIASGRKTIEVRRTRPKIETPFKCYIYETKARSDMPTFVDEDGHVLYTGCGQVIGEFVCDGIDEYSYGYDYCDGIDIDDDTILETAIDREDINIYANGKTLFGWHISNLEIYDKPKELSEFAVADKEAIRQCEDRFQSYYRFTKGGYIKNGFGCDKTDDWCFGCKRKPLARAPESWCYVEVYK